MDYGLVDSSGTDDDLPPSHQSRYPGLARTSLNGRSAVVGNVPFGEMQINMETQIHLIEQEAYTSVLRAFKAQSDAITWEKEGLITELRKELRVSDEEHRELLSRVNADDIIRRIREWRKTNVQHPGMLMGNQPGHDPVPSPTVSASHKRQKPSQSVPSLSLGAPSPTWHPSVQPSSSAMRRGSFPGARGRRPKSFSSAGRSQRPPQGSSAGTINIPAGAADAESLVGRRVWTRWPEDNNFYEAFITDYNPVEGTHALVYDVNTSEEAWEWVNLNEISPDDIRWDGDGPANPRRGGRSGFGRGIKRTRGGALAGAGRGRGVMRGYSKKEFPPSQNAIGSGHKSLGDIEILHTDTLIKEVEKVVSANHPDPAEIENAKKVLKDHEQALLEVIATLEDASDGESDGGQGQFSQGQMMNQERGWNSEGNEVGRIDAN